MEDHRGCFDLLWQQNRIRAHGQFCRSIQLREPLEEWNNNLLQMGAVSFVVVAVIASGYRTVFFSL